MQFKTEVVERLLQGVYDPGDVRNDHAIKECGALASVGAHETLTALLGVLMPLSGTSFSRVEPVHDVIRS